MYKSLRTYGFDESKYSIICKDDVLNFLTGIDLSKYGILLRENMFGHYFVQLYEVKGDHFFCENVLVNPYARNEYNDNLMKIKFDCIKNNHVIVLTGKDIDKIKRGIDIF